MGESNVERRLYKQSLPLQAALFQEIVCSLSVPVSLHAIMEPMSVDIAPALEQVLRWVLLVEGSARVGISRSLTDKKRAIISLQNFVAGGTRSRLRIGKKLRSEKGDKGPEALSESFEKLQAERGLETIRKLMESYFVDDMCRVFEKHPSGVLYRKSLQLEKEMSIGRDYMRTLSELSRSTTFLKHISPLPLLGFIVYLTGYFFDVYREPTRLGSEEEIDPWGSRRIHTFVSMFCEDACLSADNINTIGVYNSSTAATWEAIKNMDSIDICLLRTSLSASTISAIVSILPFIESRSGRNIISEFRRTVEAIHLGNDVYSQVEALKEQIYKGVCEYPFHVSVEDRGAMRNLGNAVHHLHCILNTELIPLFGIVPRSQFARLRISNLEQTCSKMMAPRMKDTVSQIERDSRRLGDFAKSCYIFADGGRERDVGAENYNSFFTLSGIDDMVEFFEKSLSFAMQLFEERRGSMKRGDASDFAAFRAETMRYLTVGSLASDLPGTFTALYEDFISKEILCGFEESSGARAPRSSKNSGRRDRSPKGNDGRTRTARERRAVNGR